MLHKTWLCLLAAMSGLMDDQARLIVEYLKEENRILREHLLRHGCKKPRLNDSQRKRLAARAKPLSRNLLSQVTELFSPDTLLGWYRKLIAAKYNGQPNVKGGRPKVAQEIIDTVLRMTRENSSWGVNRIHNYMLYLGYKVGRSTVRRVLEDHGIKPLTPKRASPTWKQFIDSHMHVMAATDFFSVELLTPKGLVRHMVLFAIDLSTRRVEILGINHSPDGTWMKQIARNLVDSESGFLSGKRYLIHDRDSLFTQAFSDTLKSAGVQATKTVRQSPNMNPFAERFVQTIKQECLDHMILTSEAQLRYVISEFVEHYHRERPHEGLGGKLITPLPQDDHGEIIGSHRLDGLLGSYRRVKTAA